MRQIQKALFLLSFAFASFGFTETIAENGTDEINEKIKDVDRNTQETNQQTSNQLPTQSPKESKEQEPAQDTPQNHTSPQESQEKMQSQSKDTNAQSQKTQSQHENLAKTKHGFVGLEASYTGIKYDEKGTLTTSALEPYSGGGLRFGLLGGYRHFFLSGIGIRGYANIDYFEAPASIGTIQSLHYGINADLLMDFREIGVFVGIGVGGVHYFGSGVDRLKSQASSSTQGFGVRQNGVETGLQLGLQSALCKSVGLEIIARVPFISHYFINKGDESNIISRQITQSYSIGARILYHF